MTHAWEAAIAAAAAACSVALLHGEEDLNQVAQHASLLSMATQSIHAGDHDKPAGSESDMD